MPLFLLNLLGFGKKYWKYILIAMAITAVVFIIYRQFVDFREHVYQQGIVAEQERTKKQTAQKNKENRELEAKLQTGLNDLAKLIQEQRDRDRAREQAILDNMSDRLNKNPYYRSPTCSVDESILKDRNAIRALGPGGN